MGVERPTKHIIMKQNCFFSLKIFFLLFFNKNSMFTTCWIIYKKQRPKLKGYNTMLKFRAIYQQKNQQKNNDNNHKLIIQ